MALRGMGLRRKAFCNIGTAIVESLMGYQGGTHRVIGRKNCLGLMAIACSAARKAFSRVLQLVFDHS